MTDTHEMRVNEQLTGNMTDLIMNSEIQCIINTTVVKALADY